MTLFAVDTFAKTIQAMIQKEIQKSKSLQIYKVTDANTKDYTVNIRHLNLINIQYNNVPIVGLGMGNYKGTFALPAPDDLVFVAFYGDASQQPVVIGSVVDSYTQNPDGVPMAAQGELLLINSTFGSIVYLTETNDIILKASNAGNINGGARLRLNHDGGFVLSNKDGYGIKVDAAGNMTISGVTVNFSQTPIPFT